jgi:ribosomal protein L21
MPEETVTFDVLMYSGDGAAVKVGSPVVEESR